MYTQYFIVFSKERNHDFTEKKESPWFLLLDTAFTQIA